MAELNPPSSVSLLQSVGKLDAKQGAIRVLDLIEPLEWAFKTNADGTPLVNATTGLPLNLAPDDTALRIHQLMHTYPRVQQFTTTELSRGKAWNLFPASEQKFEKWLPYRNQLATDNEVLDKYMEDSIDY